MRANPVPTTCALLTLAVALVAPAHAAADGLPVGVNTSKGVVSADGANTYTADPDQDLTAVRRTFEDGGWLGGKINGNYVVPGVAMDNTTSGLSHDEETLVLIEPRVRFPQDQTELIVLDPATLAVREPITLQGDFSFDALSPDGEMLYLTEYTDPRDPTRYRVRAYDLAAGELAPEPIVDKTEPEEQMRGYPLTRVTGSGGRWEYTLYDGGGHEPFVHALDTVAGEALCIDLPWVDPRRVYRTDLELVDGGGTIAVSEDGYGPVAAIDTATGEAGPIGPGAELEASEEPDPAGAESAPATDDPDEGGLGSAGLIALVVLAAGALAGFVLVATGGPRRGS